MSRDISDRNLDGELPDDFADGSVPMNKAAKSASERWGLLSKKQLIGASLKQIEERLKNPQMFRTGNYDLNEAIGGYRAHNMTIFAAATSFGKTAASILAEDAMSGCGGRTIIIACEDPEQMYGGRWLSKYSKISATKIRDAKLTPQEMQTALDEFGKASDAPFWFNAQGKTIEQICAVVRDVCKEFDDVRLVALDYLQAVRCGKKMNSRREELTYICSEFRNCVRRDTKAHALAFSQLTRYDQSKQEPTMNMVKESGDLENQAEHVIVAWRDQDGNRWFKVEKNKDGAVSGTKFEMLWDSNTASFIETHQPTYLGQEIDTGYGDHELPGTDGLGEFGDEDFGATSYD